jgi:DNA-directed RNA polymerase subunit omega
MARITIEDCLEELDNAFDICALAGKRAKDLASGADPLVESKDKPTVIALREISAGKIGMDYFEISNKEKIESQLFGDGISEEEVITELSQQLEEMPSTESLASSSNQQDISNDNTLDASPAINDDVKLNDDVDRLMHLKIKLSNNQHHYY